MQWATATVQSKYGSVSVLHWDCKADEEDEGDHRYDALETAEDELGAVLWNSNSVVLDYLHDLLGANLSHMSILELGCGVGVLGISLAGAGAETVVTDLPRLLPLMKHNVDTTKSLHKGRCEAVAFKWGDAIPTQLTRFLSRGITGIIMCDALYGNARDFPKLLESLELLCSPQTIVYNFCEQRVENVEGPFLKLLDAAPERWSYSIKPLAAASGLGMNVRVTTIKKLVAAPSVLTDSAGIVQPASLRRLKQRRKRPRTIDDADGPDSDMHR